MDFAKLVLEQEIITQQRLINDRESQGLPVERNSKRQSELTDALDNLTSSSRVIHRRESLEAFAMSIEENGLPKYTKYGVKKLVDKFLASNDG